MESNAATNSANPDDTKTDTSSEREDTPESLRDRLRRAVRTSQSPHRPGAGSTGEEAVEAPWGGVALDRYLTRLATAILDLRDLGARESVVRFVEAAAGLRPERLAEILKVAGVEQERPERDRDQP